MSEKSSEVVKCTLAACVESVNIGDEFDKMPLHVTIAPPFFVAQDKLLDLSKAYYKLIGPWAELVYDDEDTTVMYASKETDIFGTAERPVPVRRVSLRSQVETSDLLTLREWIKEATEDVCGGSATNDWWLGELHISEGDHDLSVLEGQIAVESLALFAKARLKWRVIDQLSWKG